MIDRIGQQQGNYRHNLPGQLTPLIGREQEIQTVCTLLRKLDVRMVTLTGIGGVGKTRLGLQVATDLLDEFADGVCFVPLAPISDPDLVLPTIAQALGIKEAGGRPLPDLLQDYLREKRSLLLLDNFEQILQAATDLSNLLANCPQLKMLVTSRAVLHLRGEHEFPVQPLALPDLNHLPGTEALTQYAAVALFLQSARTARLNFQVSPANMLEIAEICVRLDGLPLAIELAAARVKLLPPQALLTRLEHRLQVLTSGSRDAPVRQQTLRNTLAWSYDLLEAQEQRLFRRLCVFVGGCMLEAVEGLYTLLGDAPAYLLDGVTSLMDKSLLRQVEQEGEEPRLRMLETIREYGLEMLATSGEMESAQRAHAAYYLALVEQAELELGGPQQGAWLARLEQEHDNLRAVMEWSLEQGETQHSMELAMRLGGALRLFWWGHGHWSEGRSYLERSLSTSDGIEPFVHAKALFAAGHLAFIQSDYERAEPLCKQSLALFRELDDQPGIAFALSLLGSVAWTRGNMVAACMLTEESLAIAREIDVMGLAAGSLFILGLVASSKGEYTRAYVLLEEGLAIQRTLGDKRGIAHSLSQLAQVLFVSQADASRISPLLEECFKVSQEVGFKEGIAAYYCVSGQLALSQGELNTARVLAEKSVVLYKEMGHKHGTANSLALLGKVFAINGDYVEAQKSFEQSLTISCELNEQWVATVCLVELGEVVAVQRQLAWAVQLWGAADALRNAHGIPIPPVELTDYERSLSATRAHLGERAFATLWTQGRSMTPEQARVAKGRKTSLSSSATVPPPTYPAGLTVREVEVLHLLADGLTDLQIADKLVLSPRTVHAHISSIYTKLDVTSRSAATRYALEHHLA